MDTIFSKSNEKVKFIKSLNEKKFRQKNNAFYIEGIKVVDEILSNRKAIDILFIAISKSLLISCNGGKEILSKLESLENELTIIDIDEKIFIDLTDTVNPQGILIVVKNTEESYESIQFNNKNILLLDGVQDPGNLGTIIRTCNAFDVDTILYTKGTGDIYSPKVIRATMGAIFNINAYAIDDIENSIEFFKKNEYSIVTTSLNTDKKITDISFNKKYIFVMGNEANGVSAKLEKLSDILVKIPMTEKAESLNVGIATGIILYEQYKNKNI